MKRTGMFAIGMVLTAGVLVVGMSPSALARPHFRSQAPAVRSIVPDHGPTSGGTEVEIHGPNLVSVFAVDFGSTAATNLSVRSQNTIVATSPPGAGTVDITVTTANGVSGISSADQFTYASTPTIQSLAPRIGATSGGSQVTISGSDLSGVTSVMFGSTPATSFTVDSDIAITAVSPAEGPGKVDVTVSGAQGTSPIDPADEFTFALRIPVVTSVTPDSGPPGGGTDVIITGSQFVKKGTAVDFGSTPAATFTVLNSKTIQATTPPGSGVVDVTVTDSKGTSGTSSADEFTYASR